MSGRVGITNLKHLLWTVPPSPSFTHLADGAALTAKRACLDHAATLFNRIICELALLGVVSEPATPSHISGGVLIDDHAVITGAVGGRERSLERTIAPARHMRRNEAHGYPRVDRDHLHHALRHDRTRHLVAVSDRLPTFVASAHARFSQRQRGDALIDAWLVIEHIIDTWWTAYVTSIPNPSRRHRLSNTSTATVAARLAILHTIDALPSELYQTLHHARTGMISPTVPRVIAP